MFATDSRLFKRYAAMMRSLVYLFFLTTTVAIYSVAFRLTRDGELAFFVFVSLVVAGSFLSIERTTLATAISETRRCSSVSLSRYRPIAARFTMLYVVAFCGGQAGGYFSSLAVLKVYNLMIVTGWILMGTVAGSIAPIIVYGVIHERINGVWSKNSNDNSAH